MGLRGYLGLGVTTGERRVRLRNELIGFWGLDSDMIISKGLVVVMLRLKPLIIVH